MTTETINTALHVSAEQMLERSHWYGPNLVTILTHSSETNGAFSLVRAMLRRDFDPPLHVHSREDESNFILEGEILYTVGDEQIHAKAGDYVHLPKGTPHTFTLLTSTATTLLLITPGGFEEMFITCGRPALALELPPLTGEKPPKEFFEKLNRVNEVLGVTVLPSL